MYERVVVIRDDTQSEDSWKKIVPQEKMYLADYVVSYSMEGKLELTSIKFIKSCQDINNILFTDWCIILELIKKDIQGKETG